VPCRRCNNCKTAETTDQAHAKRITSVRFVDHDESIETAVNRTVLELPFKQHFVSVLLCEIKPSRALTDWAALCFPQCSRRDCRQPLKQWWRVTTPRILFVSKAPTTTMPETFSLGPCSNRQMSNYKRIDEVGGPDFAVYRCVHPCALNTHIVSARP